MTNLWPLIATLCLIVIAVLYVKGKEDAETFDGELRYLIACINLFPATQVAYDTIRKQYDKCKDMKHRDKEKLSIAFVLFKNIYREFFE